MSERPDEKWFFPRIESLRGYAALMVAAFHSWQAGWIDGAGGTLSFVPSAHASALPGDAWVGFLRIAANGHGAVVLFFVISGFVLMLSLARGPRQFWPAAYRFLIARLLRIYPAIFATIAIFVVLFWATGAGLAPPQAYAPVSVLRNLLLIDTSIDGVMWSLKSEVIAIPLIFAGFVLSLRWGLPPLVALAVVFAGLSFTNRWNLLLGHPLVLSALFAFIFGMIGFSLGGRLVERCPRGLGPALFVIAVAGFFVSRPLLGWYSRWAIVAEALCATAVVVLLAFGRLGPLGRPFDTRLARFYGRISYSFYLLHPLTLIALWGSPQAIGALVQSGLPLGLLAIGLFVLPAAAITPLAWGLYRFVERPGVAAGRRLIARRAPQAGARGARPSGAT